MPSEAELKPWLRPSPKSYILSNANIVDVLDGSIRKQAALTIRDGRIESIFDSTESSISRARKQGYELIDCAGSYVCPGLIDSHVHIMAVPGFSDLSKSFGNPNDVSLLRQPYVCSQMLHRGFTSVRDCGGAHLALKEAIEDGVFPGPRLFIAGHALSQSGGHADYRGSHDHSYCCGGATTGLGRICNGVSQCMQAVREEIRSGSDFIKIMGSGGVSSPTDKIDHLQFTPEEIRAMVQCASNAGTYVTAHAYTAKAIRHCVDAGVRGIEHGNFIDPDTAALLAEKDVFLTPTLVTYAEMASDAWAGFLPPESVSKNEEVLQAGLRALQIASEAGVSLCYGTDLLGPLGAAQTHEFALRSKVLTPLEVLRSATVNPARMLGRAESLGQVKSGYVADLLIVGANPLEDVTVFDDPERYLLAVVKEGRVEKSRRPDIAEDAVVPVRIKAAL
ncbi:Amidohydrolase [Pleurostoma richardsiae]|uniref:Amidohydrolase n=1 Tax=Pleurostoma richardsiae TaxID=41990 RepID=A0AA38RFY0_9PEZI|nr:Amidohydrolase [Pleurostoma richardsiae]